MGLIIFLLIVAGIITIIVLVKIKKKKEHRAKFYGSIAYSIAEQIKDELVKIGYSAGHPSKPGEWVLNYRSKDGFYGSLSFYDGDKKYIGCLSVDFRQDEAFQYAEASFTQTKNADALRGQFYVIINDLFGLYVNSNEESKEIPPFIEIAARVIENSGYKFAHPDWWFEMYPDAKAYLNVMFQ